MMNSLKWLAASLLVVSVAGTAQISSTSALLSESDGRGMTVGDLNDLREGWRPEALTGAAIATEFSNLCLGSDFTLEEHARSAAASTWDWKPAVSTLEATKKQPEVIIPHFENGYSRTTFWSGRTADLDKRPKSMRDRGAVITGPISAKRLASPQCNLDLKVAGFRSGEELASTLTLQLGAQPTKLVLKDGFADGWWDTRRPDGTTTRVWFSVVGMKQNEQLVHLSVVTVPTKAAN